MSAYHYQALSKTGQNLKGIIEADSERQARQLLRERGIVPLSLRTLNATSRQPRARHRVSSQDLALLTRQLATLLAAGIPVEEALRGVSEQTQKEKVRGLLMGVRAKVVEGYGLSQAMSDFPAAFPELYRATVGAGEQTGHLDVVLEKLANYTERQQANKQKIQQALIYPSVMIVVSISIIAFLLVFVIPKMIEVFESSGQALPKMTEILLLISHWMQHNGLFMALSIIFLFFGFKKSLSNLKIRALWDRFLLKTPIFAYLLRTINVARYIDTFGILFAAGVSVLETMRVAASLVTNTRMSCAFQEAMVRVREGESISQSLKETGFLTPMAIHLIASGEKSGQIASMMDRTATSLDGDVKRLIDTGLTLLEPMVILFMGGVVLFIVLAALLPIFSMEQLVG